MPVLFVLIVLLVMGCKDDSKKPTEPDANNDRTAPARILDFRLVGWTETSVTLAWTAPGDDGHEGTASRYELLVGLRWDSSGPGPALPPPRPAGSKEVFTVTDLAPASGYVQFGIRAVDEAGNASYFSNAVIAKTSVLDDVRWWNGFAPAPDGAGVKGVIRTFVVWNGLLIAGGKFDCAGEQSGANNVAAWDGSSWSLLGGGLGGNVRALAVYQGRLVAGGDFTQAEDRPVPFLAQWNGAGWESIGSVRTNPVSALAAMGDTLYVASGTVGGGVDRWNGVEWRVLGGLRSDYETISLAVHEGALYVAGFGSNPEDYDALMVMRWDGAQWRKSLHGGAGGPYCFYSPRTIASIGGSLWLGGVRCFAGICMLGRWTGAAWESRPPNLSLADDEDCVAVEALGEWRGRLVVGGHFRTGLNAGCFDIGLMDGGEWRSLGSGLGQPIHYWGDPVGSVFALAEYQGSLYVGGSFAFAGGKQSEAIARWDE